VHISAIPLPETAVVPFAALLGPIVLSAVLVFVVSSLVHMVLKYHAADYRQLPNEDAVRAAINAGDPEPRQYVIPYAADMQAMGSPEMKRKYAEGPVAVLNIKPRGEAGMGGALGAWFVFALVVSAIVAYVAWAVLPRGTHYLKIFQVVGATAWLAYAAGQLPAAIWMGKPWPVAWKEVVDGLLYALVTAGAFGWLWPR
jgi:hypothetical protein